MWIYVSTSRVWCYHTRYNIKILWFTRRRSVYWHFYICIITRVIKPEPERKYYDVYVCRTRLQWCRLFFIRLLFSFFFFFVLLYPAAVSVRRHRRHDSNNSPYTIVIILCREKETRRHQLFLTWSRVKLFLVRVAAWRILSRNKMRRKNTANKTSGWLLILLLSTFKVAMSYTCTTYTGTIRYTRKVAVIVRFRYD